MPPSLGGNAEATDMMNEIGFDSEIEASNTVELIGTDTDECETDMLDGIEACDQESLSETQSTEGYFVSEGRPPLPPINRKIQ